MLSCCCIAISTDDISNDSVARICTPVKVIIPEGLLHLGWFKSSYQVHEKLCSDMIEARSSKRYFTLLKHTSAYRLLPPGLAAAKPNA